jgi:predicted transposase/invertase (TIGR01784 family)
VEQVIIVIEKASDDLEANQLSHSFFNTVIRYILSTRKDVPIDEVKERLPVEGRKEFMSVADQLRKEGLEKGLEKGLEQGKKSEKKETAKRMLHLNMDMEQIIAATGLSENAIKELENTLE